MERRRGVTSESASNLEVLLKKHEKAGLKQLNIDAKRTLAALGPSETSSRWSEWHRDAKQSSSREPSEAWRSVSRLTIRPTFLSIMPVFEVHHCLFFNVFSRNSAFFRA